MRILYGIVGEGMGHATRSRVVLDHLLASGHEIHVVVSGRAHQFLVDRFKNRPKIRFDAINGLVLRFEGNALDKSETFKANLEALPAGVRQNIEVYRKVAEDGFEPELVISDFESWAFLYGLNHRLPVISIDNMQVINRCRHEADVVGREDRRDFRLAKWLVKAKMPGAYHYLASSFFFPPVRKPRTTLIPPILRPEILDAKREPGTHVLVYQTAANNPGLLDVLKSLPYEFRIYGMGGDRVEGNLTLCPFSETGFVDDLRTARAVVASGGYSLMGEAVHLQVPMLAVPLDGQFEQVLNCRYLQKLGYGAYAEALDAETISTFLSKTDAYQAAVSTYAPHDNQLLFGCVDALLRHVELGEPAPTVLEVPSMGRFEEDFLAEDAY